MVVTRCLFVHWWEGGNFRLLMRLDPQAGGDDSARFRNTLSRTILFSSFCLPNEKECAVLCSERSLKRAVIVSSLSGANFEDQE
jgi:hypothetical protein